MVERPLCMDDHKCGRPGFRSPDSPLFSLRSLPIPKTVEGRCQIGAIRIVVETLFWYLEVASPDVNVLSAKWKISECTRD